MATVGVEGLKSAAHRKAAFISQSKWLQLVQVVNRTLEPR